MKKILTIVLTMVMSLGLVACGNKVKGETFDGGNIEVFVPEGWKAFHGPDIFDDYKEGYNPNVVQIGKGVKDELDLFSYPMIDITYSGDDNTLYKPSKDIYEDGKDIKDIKTEDYTWEGFTAKSLGYPIAILFTEVGDKQIQVSITLENGDQKITLEDEDVLAILEGIKIKK